MWPVAVRKVFWGRLPHGFVDDVPDLHLAFEAGHKVADPHLDEFPLGFHRVAFQPLRVGLVDGPKNRVSLWHKTILKRPVDLGLKAIHAVLALEFHVLWSIVARGLRPVGEAVCAIEAVGKQSCEMPHPVGVAKSVAEKCVEAPELLAPEKGRACLHDLDREAFERLAFIIDQGEFDRALPDFANAAPGRLQIVSKRLWVVMTRGVVHVLPFLADRCVVHSCVFRSPWRFED